MSAGMLQTQPVGPDTMCHCDGGAHTHLTAPGPEYTAALALREAVRTAIATALADGLDPARIARELDGSAYHWAERAATRSTR